jgi:hypothetical protein
MNKTSNNPNHRRWPTALLAVGLFVGASAPAIGQPIGSGSLLDRAQIEDLLTRYYYNFGKAGGGSFGTFYTDDAEMSLGKTSYKGREAIEGAYKALSTADIPQRKSFSFNILMTNPLIVVHGSTASARLIFTEVVIDKQGDAPRILTQGKEFDTLVKVKGVWRISKRQILGAEQGPPSDWQE